MQCRMTENTWPWVSWRYSSKYQVQRNQNGLQKVKPIAARKQVDDLTITLKTPGSAVHTAKTPFFFSVTYSCLCLMTVCLRQCNDRRVGWTTEETGVGFLARAYTSRFPIVETDVVNHPVSHPVRTRSCFRLFEEPWGVKLTTHLRLVPRLKSEWN
jgi:hypothetical protein